jgi:hypothetical protein
MPLYEERYVLYFDVLGFSELIERSRQNPTIMESFLQVLRILDHRSREVHAEDGYVRISNFSDCVCISFPVNDVRLESTLVGLAATSVAMLALGYPIRGAITRGPIHHHGNAIFGPALVRAYELETRAAIYPRVILDSTLIYTTSEQLRSIGARPVIIDRDGFRYVNFLDPMWISAVSISLDAPIDRTKLGKLIDDQAAATADRPHVHMKYVWLQTYFSEGQGA